MGCSNKVWDCFIYKDMGGGRRLSYGIGFGGTEKEGHERKWASWHAF